MKRILFPVEDLNIPEKAFEMARELGESMGVEFILLHVQPYNEPMTYPYAHIAEPWDDEAFAMVTDRILESAAAKFSSAGLVAVTKIASGDPATEILEYAEEENCDMILMSTHGMGTIKRFLLGSVANKVVHHAKVPVMIAR